MPAPSPPRPLPVDVIKEGHVSVRGPFVWRDRFLCLKKGELTIRRRRGGAIKAIIDLLDSSVRLVFHDEQSLITISSHGKDTVLNCHTTSERDAWVSALFSAREQLEADCESEIVMSNDDGDDMDQYSTVLSAFQDARSSILQCHLTILNSKEDLFVSPDASVLEMTQLHSSTARSLEEEIRERCLRAIVLFIETTAVGGRAVLLHLGVIASAGISLKDILHSLGEEQKDKPRRPSFTSTTVVRHRSYVSAFVRDIIFHPIYSKRPEACSLDVNQAIDRYFQHCRLRRFSHEVTDHSLSIRSPAMVGKYAASGQSTKEERFGTTLNVVPASDSGAHPPPASTSKLEMIAKQRRKRHSFPNIFLPLMMQTSNTNDEASGTSKSSTLDGGSNIDGIGDLGPPEFERVSSNDSDLFHDEMIVEPLRCILWKHTCVQVAEQLSLFHHGQLSSLCLWDFLHNPKEAAREISDHFNRLVTYLVWSVLVEDTPKERAEVIEHIIAIAQEAVKQRNFSLVMACVGCLGDTPLMVSRLPATWKKVKVSCKSDLQELRALCNHTGGFENLRKHQTEQSTQPCVPFIGVLGVALERLRSTNYFDNKLLDVDKLERQYLVVSVIEQSVQMNYPFARNSGFQSFLQTLNVAFATHNVLQCRSQQILTNEAPSGVIASRTSTFHRQLLGTGGSPSDNSLQDDNHAFLSFRQICGIIATVPQPQERVHICLEALFADDRLAVTKSLRKFWLDFKQNIFLSAAHVALLGIKRCIEALQRDVTTQKTCELLQVSSSSATATAPMLVVGAGGIGANDLPTEVQRLVYEKLVAIATQPIWSWTLSKVKHAFAAEDRRLQAAIQAMPRSSSSTAPLEAIGLLLALDSATSPVAAAALLGRTHSLLVSTATAHNDNVTQTSISTADLPDQPTDAAVQRFLEVVTALPPGSFEHPFSLLYTLQQVLDVSLLSMDVRAGLLLLEAAIARLDAPIATQSSSSRASFTTLTSACSDQANDRAPLLLELALEPGSLALALAAAAPCTGTQQTGDGCDRATTQRHLPRMPLPLPLPGAPSSSIDRLPSD